MKRRDTEGTVLIEECRWRIQGAIDGGASAQEVADAAGVSNVTIYSYLGRGEGAVKYGSPRTAERILAVFGARIVVVMADGGKVKQTRIIETIV